jgi:hypothetical protein
MLYEATVAVSSEINMKHINTVWAKYRFLNFLNSWCKQPIAFIG